MSAVRRGYELMYDARNDFIHGNPVEWGTLLSQTGAGRVNLYQLAPLIYRAALVGYLARRYAMRPLRNEPDSCALAQYMAQVDYWEALQIALGEASIKKDDEVET
jgi:hypothetical protein